jgi:hypothetical protein
MSPRVSSAKADGGVVATFGLSVWLDSLSLARPQSFGLILVGVPWGTRAAT